MAPPHSTRIFTGDFEDGLSSFHARPLGTQPGGQEPSSMYMPISGITIACGKVLAPQSNIPRTALMTCAGRGT